MPIRMNAAASVALLAAAVLTAAPAFAQNATSWEYKSYKKDGYGQYSKDNFTVGKISIAEKEGQASFRMIAGRLDVCYNNELPAVVTRTADETLIEVTKVVPGCEEFRYTIKNDGSGGFKETKVGERWRKSRFDHGLTPVKQ